ncbi:helix-turn-helix domain-containing protein [Streptomyces sp. NPDC056601]|uniref:helix-turn-helix domain-containing protein n=1 Tax=Streptomyces sp. NPDC056601 TaxID=3345875 RepID=UPI0036A75224
MGREKPIPDPSSALGRLAQELRRGRRSVRKSYDELAENTAFSATTFSRAAAGKLLPRREVARGFGHACGLDIDTIDALWLAARQETRKVSGARRVARAPRTLSVTDMPQLCRALGELRLFHGEPSYAHMRKRAAAAGLKVSTSTLQRIATSEQAPSSRRVVRAYLVGCGLGERTIADWEQAWDRVHRRYRAAREREAQLRELNQREAMVADRPDGRVSSPRAVELLKESGFVQIERYRGFNRPWTVLCAGCGISSRIRLAYLLRHGPDPCTNCVARESAVTTAWKALTQGHSTLPRVRSESLSRARFVGVDQKHGHLTLLLETYDALTRQVIDEEKDWRHWLDNEVGRALRRREHVDVIVASADTH